MPTVLEIDGFRLFFYSADRNEPPHIHIRKAGQEAKFWLDPIRPARLGRFKRGDMQRMIEILEENKHSSWSGVMNILTAKYILEKLEGGAKAVDLMFTDDNLIVELEDGRTISVPVMYYPRLYHGSLTERENWVIEGEGIHWPDLNEDIRTADLLIGLPSAESQESLRRWLEARKVKV